MENMPNLEQLDDAIRGFKYFNFINSLSRCNKLDIAFQRFYDLYYIFAGANFDLEDAANEDLSIDKYETNAESTLRYFLRSLRLKNTILAYNSVEDYIKKIVKFLSSTEEIQFKDESEFIEVNKKAITYKDAKKFARDIDNIIGNNSLEKVLKRYHNKEEIREIRRLANDIKHNGDIRFKELPRPSYAGYVIKDEGNLKKVDAKEKYNSKWVEVEPVELEETIKLCYRANNIIKKYIEDVYKAVCKLYRNYNLEELK